MATNQKRKRMYRDKLLDKPWGLCGEPIDQKAEFTLDHIVPLSKGGKTEWTNLQAAHRVCNLTKGNEG